MNSKNPRYDLYDNYYEFPKYPFAINELYK